MRDGTADVFEDRHNPLPHITLLTTAPKSVYGKRRHWLLISVLSWGNFRSPADRNGRDPVVRMRFPAQPDYAKRVIEQKAAAALV